MAEFQYRIITPEGKEKRGSMEARSVEQATMLLKSQKNIVLNIEEANVMNRDISFSFMSKVSARDYSIFCRQFVSVIRAGVSIINALEMMRDQTENKKLKAALKEVHEDVSKGESLAIAMKKRSKVFPTMLCNMVEAGEASGSLDVAFERMAVQFEKENKLNAAVTKAIIYPVVLIVVMLGVLLLMMFWVIPTFMGMFSELGTKMPPLTQFIIDMSDFFIAKWWLLLLILIAAAISYKLYAGTVNGQLVLGKIKLKMPIFGKLQMKTECARLGRTLCTLLGAGVPMIEALEITARSMDNIHYKRAMMDAKDQVTRGVVLSRPLKTSGLFPPMVTHMVSIGEETGNIEDMLENVADYFEDDVQVATEQMTALMEPIIIVVMALAVGVMIMAILQPMFTLYESIG